jgi:hypothetical protein
MAIGFNTGRLYQADGQRISVGLASDGMTILFQDHSRGIFGALELSTSELSYVYSVLSAHAGGIDIAADYCNFARIIMRAYDAYKHRYHPEADKVVADSWPLVRV